MRPFQYFKPAMPVNASVPVKPPLQVVHPPGGMAGRGTPTTTPLAL